MRKWAGYSLGDYPQEEQRQRIIVADVVEAGEELVAHYTQFTQSLHPGKPPEPPYSITTNQKIGQGRKKNSQ